MKAKIARQTGMQTVNLAPAIIGLLGLILAVTAGVTSAVVAHAATVSAADRNSGKSELRPGDRWRQALSHADQLRTHNGEMVAALSAFRKDLLVKRHSRHPVPNSTRQQIALAIDLVDLAQAGGAAETHLTEALGIMREIEPDDLTAGQRRWIATIARDLAETKGELAHRALFERRFHLAEVKSRQALKLAPDALWLKTNLAHALMFLNRTSEAESLYRAHRGRMLPGMSWEAAVLAEFDALRAQRIHHPLMTEIEALFGR